VELFRLVFLEVVAPALGLVPVQVKEGLTEALLHVQLVLQASARTVTNNITA
jgi:hypothetical protein